MERAFVANRNNDSCWLAAFESYLLGRGIHRTQEEMIAAHPDLCQVIRPGIIPMGRESFLCQREGIACARLPSVQTVNQLCTVVARDVDFIVGVTFGANQCHAVLIDSIGANGHVRVMDPDWGLQYLDNAQVYPNITELALFKLG